MRAVARGADAVLREVAPADIAAAVANANTTLWLDLEQPQPLEFALLRDIFGFHELAIEDAERTHQRAKVDYYEGFRFIVLYAIVSTDGILTPREVDVFAGERYVVTVHRDPMPDFAEVEQRWQHAVLRVDTGNTALFYAVLDAIVDGYFPALDQIAEQVEQIEEDMIAGSGESSLTRLFGLKKQLIALRRVLAPERDLLNGFLRREWPGQTAVSVTYFQDVYDHVVRVIDSLDTYQDLLSNVLDVYVSLTSNSLNVVVKRLTAIATVFAVPTIVFSLYGMNFQHMPELQSEYGYPIVLASTLVVTLGMALVLRVRGWL